MFAGCPDVVVPSLAGLANFAAAAKAAACEGFAALGGTASLTVVCVVGNGLSGTIAEVVKAFNGLTGVGLAIASVGLM